MIMAGPQAQDEERSMIEDSGPEIWRRERKLRMMRASLGIT
jgi:hypothetical protein